jgi:hypothetical protein
MVVRGLSRLGMSLRQHVLRVFLPALALFVVTLVAVSNLRSAHLFRSAWGDVVASAALSGAILLAFLWCLVLDSSQRGRLFAWRALARSPGLL